MSATDKRKFRHVRLRKKLAGTPTRPRLAVHFSGQHITAQVIDDTIGKTLVSVNTTEAELRAKFHGLADAVLGAERAKQLADAVIGLDQAGDVNALMRLGAPLVAQRMAGE
jgi:large subunit ribosomal protein L18